MQFPLAIFAIWLVAALGSADAPAQGVAPVYEVRPIG
jgi:hypothetical protein